MRAGWGRSPHELGARVLRARRGLVSDPRVGDLGGDLGEGCRGPVLGSREAARGRGSYRSILFGCSPRLYGGFSTEGAAGPNLASPVARKDLGSSPASHPCVWFGSAGVGPRELGATEQRQPDPSLMRAWSLQPDAGPGLRGGRDGVCRGRCEVGGRWEPSPGGWKEPGLLGVQEGQPGQGGSRRVPGPGHPIKRPRKCW